MRKNHCYESDGEITEILLQQFFNSHTKLSAWKVFNLSKFIMCKIPGKTKASKLKERNSKTASEKSMKSFTAFYAKIISRIKRLLTTDGL